MRNMVRPLNETERVEIYEHQGGHCGQTGEYRPRTWDIHHIKERDCGGLNTRDNLIMLSRDVHRRYHDAYGKNLSAVKLIEIVNGHPGPLARAKKQILDGIIVGEMRLNGPVEVARFQARLHDATKDAYPGGGVLVMPQMAYRGCIVRHHPEMDGEIQIVVADGRVTLGSLATWAHKTAPHKPQPKTTKTPMKRKAPIRLSGKKRVDVFDYIGASNAPLKTLKTELREKFKVSAATTYIGDIRRIYDQRDAFSTLVRDMRKGDVNPRTAWGIITYQTTPDQIHRYLESHPIKRNTRGRPHYPRAAMERAQRDLAKRDIRASVDQIKVRMRSMHVSADLGISDEPKPPIDDNGTPHPEPTTVAPTPEPVVDDATTPPPGHREYRIWVPHWGALEYTIREK